MLTSSPHCPAAPMASRHSASRFAPSAQCRGNGLLRQHTSSRSLHPPTQHRAARRAAGVIVLASAQDATVLVGDIGGTNARLALWRAEGPKASAELFAKRYPTADHSTFDDVMGVFLAESRKAGAPPSAAALAVAGAVEDNRCAMTNISWVVDGDTLAGHYGFKVQVLNDFEAVGYGIPALEPDDVVELTKNKPKAKAPKVVMGPGTGLGAAQLMWDDGLQDYKVWPGEGAHATFAPRGYKQMALAAYAARQADGHVEVEQVACGSGLELIYEFLISDDLAGNPVQGASRKTAAEITTAALGGKDPLAVEAVDLLMAIVGAEAGAMALRCMAKGGIYIAGGITPRLLPRLSASATGGGMLLEGILGRNLRPKFRDFLATLPVSVITNDKVGQIGAWAVATKLLKRG